MPANLGTEQEAARQNAANPQTLDAWLKNRLLAALLPLARGLLGKLAVRYGTALAAAVVAWLESSGLAAAVPDAAKIAGAVVLLAGLAVDVGVSYVSHRLHLVPKAEPVEPGADS